MKECIFLFTLFLCAVTDIVTFRIKNPVLGISAIWLLFFELFISPDGDPGSDILSAAVVLIVFIPFYLLGAVRAGDIKLLSLTAMYTGIPVLCSLVLYSAAASVTIITAISTVRREPITKIKYPFAFALFLGALPLWLCGITE